MFLDLPKSVLIVKKKLNMKEKDVKSSKSSAKDGIRLMACGGFAGMIAKVNIFVK